MEEAGPSGGAGGDDPSGGGGDRAADSGGAGDDTTASGGTTTGSAGRATVDAGSDDTACEANSLRCAGNTPEVCDASQTWRPLLACEEPTRCIDGKCEQTLANACPLAATLPRFESDSHVVDGDGSEFSDIPPVTYALRSAPVVNPAYAEELPTLVTLRLAWSESAFVAHVHVDDPAVYTYQGSTLEYFWQGDNVQFFIAPTDALTGMYSGTEDSGAAHLMIVPPTDTQPAAALEMYEPCYACVDASLSLLSYAARAVAGGYEIELSWPWSAPQGVLSSGDRIALNVIVGAGDDPSGGLQLEGLLANNPVAGETPCGGATHPGCDDRTWCYSVLE